MRYRPLAPALLEQLGAILDELSSTGKPPADPWIVLLSGLLLNAVASFARSPLVPVLALAFGALLSSISRKLKAWLKTTLLVAAFTSVVAAPAALQGGLPEALLLLARASGAAGAFIGAVASLGWFWLLFGLSQLRLLNPLTWQLWLTIRMIPAFSRAAARMLAAREARVFVSSRKAALEAAGSTLGDLLLEGYRRARALSMAVAARAFVDKPQPLNFRPRLSWSGAALMGYAALTTALFIAGA
ncbi:MAG: CbiQ family ECF transporter T component [Thermofilaceae archaeon]